MRLIRILPLFLASIPGSAQSSSPVTITATYNGSSASTTISVASTTTSASATFLATDASNKGTWQGIYGADGYNVVGSAASYPSYATVTMGGTAYTWAASTTDVRALQKPGTATDRVAACVYGSSFVIDVNLSDTSLHQVGLYAVDWDARARAESVTVTDSSGTVLDTRTFSSFGNGTYLLWSVRGHVRFQIALTGGVNAVLSGIFFDTPGSSASVSASAAFVTTDHATKGKWKGVYGTDGYFIPSDGVKTPSYASGYYSGTAYVWASSSSEERALQKSASSATDRIASCLYGTSQSIELKFSDSSTHPVALYFVDWDSTWRNQTITITDADTGTVLDSRAAASFNGGIYLVWNITGHVRFQISLNGGINTVLSGIFFK